MFSFDADRERNSFALTYILCSLQDTDALNEMKHK